MIAQVVSFHCVLKDKSGRVISSTFNQDVLTYDENQKEVLFGLAKGLQNLKKGEKRRIVVSAGEAYGFYDPRRVLHCSRKELNGRPSLNLGDVVQLEKDIYRVTEVRGERVTLDANHPLAGQDLIFEIEATAARFATAEDFGGPEHNFH